MNNFNNYANHFSSTPQAPYPSSYPTNPNPYATGAAANNLASNANFLNALNTITAPQNAQMNPQGIDLNSFVAKDEYERVLQEKKALQEKLESELAQRVDIEFFRIEQEMLTLPEGARLAQELEYQKSRFFDALWKTSEPGKIAITKYRDSVQGLYDQYRASLAQPIQPKTTMVEKAPLNTEPVPPQEQVF